MCLIYRTKLAEKKIRDGRKTQANKTNITKSVAPLVIFYDFVSISSIN